MRIKTDYVPDDCDYLTAGKVYEARDYTRKNFGITCDNGMTIFLNPDESETLNGRAWQIVEDEPFDISEHVFDDTSVKSATVVNYGIVIESRSKDVLYFKKDIIALAKAMGVTGGDL